MTLQSSRPLATFLVLTLIPALWAPTLGGIPAHASPPLVVAATAPLVLM